VLAAVGEQQVVGRALESLERGSVAVFEQPLDVVGYFGGLGTRRGVVVPACLFESGTNIRRGRRLVQLESESRMLGCPMEVATTGCGGRR
jgi:hypothetical protein